MPPARRALRLLAAAACIQVAGAAACAGHPLLAEWNAAVLEAVRISCPPPCLAARNLAILHGACFDAANAASGRYAPFHYTGRAPDGVVPEAAVAGAAWRCARALFPSEAALFDALRDRQLAALDRPGDAVAVSFSFGARVGDGIIAARADDGASMQITYIPRNEPGKWRRTPPLHRPPETPHWGRVRPFSLERADQFRPPGPPQLDSPEYAEALAEVRALGGAVSAVRNASEEEGARFWSAFKETVTPPGQWNQIARDIAVARGLSLLESARLLALLNIACADAGIATWECKYHYEFWRPVHAVAAAGGGTGWTSLLETPPHPEYVSGHSAFSAAAARVLQAYFGTDAVAFTAVSSVDPAVRRSYGSLRACAEEIGRSRIFGGIHFSFANRDGLELGRRVADWVVARALLPVRGTEAAMLD